MLSRIHLGFKNNFASDFPANYNFEQSTPQRIFKFLRNTTNKQNITLQGFPRTKHRENRNEL